MHPGTEAIGQGSVRLIPRRRYLRCRTFEAPPAAHDRAVAMPAVRCRRCRASWAKTQSRRNCRSRTQSGQGRFQSATGHLHAHGSTNSDFRNDEHSLGTELAALSTMGTIHLHGSLEQNSRQCPAACPFPDRLRPSPDIGERSIEAGKNGGPSRNRTGVQGFAVLCVTTPPSGRGETRALARWRASGQAPQLVDWSFDEMRLAGLRSADKSGLNSRCIIGI